MEQKDSWNATGSEETKDNTVKNISEEKNCSNEEYDMALKIACEKFEEMHPQELQPKWLKYCMRIRQTRNENRNWVFKFILTTKFQLNADLHWEWDENGLAHIIHIDPLTGKRSYVICDGGAPAETEVFFAVEVDNKRTAIVLEDTDLNLFDGTKYQLNIVTEWKWTKQ